MKARFRPAWLGAGLFMLAMVAIVPGISTVRGERATDSPKARPILFHLHRGRLSASFLLANDATIRIGTNASANLMELRVGQVAHVRYTIENGVWLAHEVVVNPPHEGHAAKTLGTHANELHAHGAILGYDSSTGRLTIRYHR